MAVTNCHLDMKSINTGSAECDCSGAMYHNLQTPVFKAALAHVLLLLGDKAFDDLKSNAELFIEVGCISSFSGLIECIRTRAMVCSSLIPFLMALSFTTYPASFTDWVEDCTSHSL